MNNPITQSKLWQKLQDDLGENCIFKEGKDYHFLAIEMKTPVGNYLYCPYGPVAKNESAFKEALIEIKNLAREKGAIFIRIEPQDKDYQKLLPKNAKKSKDLNPKDTWVLDLTPEKAGIITNFSQGTRTRFNTFSKKGLEVEKTKNPDEIKHLVKLQNQLFKAKNLHTFSEKYLRTELEQPFATLYLVKYHTPEQATDSANKSNNQTPLSSQPAPDDGQILAASLFFNYDGTRYYMQSAADNTFKKLPATVALLTTAIFDAKEQGIKLFDFWGIAPDDAPKDHPWIGFTEFKKSFGGEARHYLGTYDLPISAAKYKLYQSTRKFGKLIRKTRV